MATRSGARQRMGKAVIRIVRKLVRQKIPMAHTIGPYVAEFVGTMLLVLLGDGVVANVVLSRTKGHQGGWVVIALGWAMAVFVGVSCAKDFSGAHLNPAVTIALAVAQQFT